MEECPCCGHKEALCWHAPTFRGLEMPYCKIEELRLEDPKLAKIVEAGNFLRKNVLEITVGCYVYKYSTKSSYVRRRHLDMWKAAKWGPIFMEKSKRVAKGQSLLIDSPVCNKKSDDEK